MKPKTIIILVLLALFLTILLQNTNVVSIQLLFWKIEMSRIILFSLTLVIGVLIGYILGIKNKRKKSKESIIKDT